MAIPLLQTKLYIPRARPELVARPRLIERLNEGMHCKLTLISATAGFGKTTLVSEWLHDLGRPAAWLSLDDQDSEATRFWSYLIAALRTIHTELGQATLNLLQVSQLPPAQALLTPLLNEIAALSQTFTLVLDNYHPGSRG
jgi:LuxR family maltose regulon positive regulatory protein